MCPAETGKRQAHRLDPIVWGDRGIGLLTIYFRPMEPRWRQTLRG